MRKLRVAADAMYLARAFASHRPGTAPKQLLEAWALGEIHLVISGQLIDEVARALVALGAAPSAIKKSLDTLCSDPEQIVALKHQVMGCADPDDDHLLEAAHVGGARWVLSEDAALLNLPAHVRTMLQSYRIDVIPLSEFLTILDMVRDAPDDSIFTFDLPDGPFSCLGLSLEPPRLAVPSL